MKPFYCQYYVTETCNAKCNFCNIWKNPKIADYPDLETTKKYILQLKENGVKYIDFTGGEPLLRPDIFKMIDYAHDLGIKCLMTTNTLLFPKRFHEMNIENVYSLAFSIDSIIKEEHEANRGVNGIWNTLMESIKICKDNNIDFNLLFTLTRKNINELPQLYDFCRKNKIKLSLNFCFDYQNSFGDQIPPIEKLKQVKKYLYKRGVIFNVGYIDFVINGGNNINKSLCGALKYNIAVDSYGKVFYPCYHNKMYRISFEEFFSNCSNFQVKSGSYEFCKGCAIGCYFNFSLWKKYPISSILSGLKFLVTKNFE